ncbi:efflux RND transporter periplasmic adaptor subunit [Congregicoccus parvus]|uniref:efflux RND transporter periplasmic adaptor subunit n=1 Tax=Congregicoccus parvus TaxID=3081749 RepID=UPI003FA5A11D
MAPDKKTLDALRIERPSAPPRRSRVPAALVVLLLLLAGAIAFWWLRRPAVALVQTAVAESVQGDVGPRTLLNASGYVTARRAATVSSKVTGRVIEVLVEEGMAVREGQELARLDDTNTRASLRLAQAQLAAARESLGETEANLDLAVRNRQRTAALADAKVVSAADVDAAEGQVAALQARLARQRAEITVAENQVDVWKQQLDDTIIRAPFDGVVTSKNAQPGEMISPMSSGGFTRTGICTLVDMSSLEVEVDVNESYINRVAPGQPVEVVLDSYPDWRIAARVIAIIPSADRQKATVRVRVGFDALDPRILPDMGLKVAFQGTDEPTAGGNGGARNVRVPASSIRRDSGRDVVWLVRDGRLERRAITVSDRRGDTALISGGLSGGERVVVRGPDLMADGLRVKEQET